MVRAGDHWSLRISKQMAPDCDEMFGCLPGREGGRMGGKEEGGMSEKVEGWGDFSKDHAAYMCPREGGQANAIIA